MGALGPPAYIVLVTTLGWLWSGYDPLRQTQSELGGVDSPVQQLMNVGGFMALGGTVLAAAYAYCYVLRGRRLVRYATALLVLAGAGLIAVGFAPCDPGCVDVTSTGRAHSLLSAPPSIALPLAAALSAVALRDPPFGGGWPLASVLSAAGAMATGPLVGLELVSGVAGLVQRAGMWLSLLWLAAVSRRIFVVLGGRPPGQREGDE